MPADERSGAQLEPIGDRVVFENESIRVWRLSVPPAGIKRMHRHDLPYLIVPVSGGRAEITTIDGAVRTHEDRPGVVIWQDAGETHQFRNLTSTPYENVLVELKQHRPTG
ncbi:MAG TPA: cupin [Candidatus Dormibacteraeota bacterium]|nr:cupin [Candidatus Dormibacteraeota bacterium]